MLGKNMITNSKLVAILDDENVLMVAHRNWFHIAKQYFILLNIAFVFFVAVISLPLLFPAILGGQLGQILKLVETFFAMALWVYGFLIWIDYYYDLWIITDKRLINIEQDGLFSRKTSELDYAKVQDITVDVKGFFPTMLNYGDVQVQTAGEEENFLFRTISNPLGVKTLIMKQVQTDERESINELGEMLHKRIENDQSA